VRYQYRITKYDPALRDEDGAYRRDEWISRSDIGRSYNGEVLTEAGYQAVEDAYLFAVEAFLTEAGVDRLILRGVENRREDPVPSWLAEGASLSVPQCVDFARMALRESVWGHLAVPGQAYVHFGYDYYMYVGVPARCPAAIAETQRRGLFVEDFRSPYLRARRGKGE
jgi:hypothetical protein